MMRKKKTKQNDLVKDLLIIGGLYALGAVAPVVVPSATANSVRIASFYLARTKAIQTVVKNLSKWFDE